MKQKRKLGRKLLSFLLTLALVLGLMPGMSLTAYAASVYDGNSYVNYGGDDVKLSAFGVRPALKLDLSKVVFDSTSNTFSVAGGNVDVTGVTLTPLAKQTINVGEKVSFTASVSPDNATDKKVKW